MGIESCIMDGYSYRWYRESSILLSKAEIGEWPVFGKLAHAAGTLFIERGSGDAGSVSSQIADFLAKGFSVIFFPEATTTSGKKNQAYSWDIAPVSDRC
ncbi:hypothetical protein PKHYL_06390 [Psychrobacter sp. KH172YL61]|nr:hypothetical protein PKHYL_06390 [Psychrobacter sp. KH172YL61]